MRAWQALRAGTDVRELRPWLYRIAHNQALNTLRAAGSALPAVAAELPAISLEAEVERREELRAALHGIEALPDRQRAALVAIAVADRPHADVARELGMSDGALRQLLLRARTTLRAAAAALTPYPLMSWLAGGQEATAARVAEVAVGAGGAGVALKAGAAVARRGRGLAGGPALRGDHRRRPRKAGAGRAPSAIAARGRARRASRPAPTADHARGRPGGAGADTPRTLARPAAVERPLRRTAARSASIGRRAERPGYRGSGAAAAPALGTRRRPLRSSASSARGAGRGSRPRPTGDAERSAPTARDRGGRNFARPGRDRLAVHGLTSRRGPARADRLGRRRRRPRLDGSRGGSPAARACQLPIGLADARRRTHAAGTPRPGLRRPRRRARAPPQPAARRAS